MVRRRDDERGLVTLLFTDIVGSSDAASELGDQRWHRLQARHHATVRKQLKRYGGHEVDTAGDGFFITFSSPGRGVRCAFAIVREIRDLGLDVRAGLHIGEAQLAGEKVGGIAVTTAARVSAAAGPGQVLATDTIVHLIAGSGLDFTDLGQRELKGVPGRREIFSLDAVDGESLGAPLDPQAAAEHRRRASPVEHVPDRRRIVWPAALALAVLLATVIVVSRRQGDEAPQAPIESPAVQETLAILSADTGRVVLRPPGVASSGHGGTIGTSGPIVLTEPVGRAHQSFAWIFSGVLGFHLKLQKLNQANGEVVNTFGRLNSCTPPGCLAELDGKIWFLIPWKASSIPSGVAAQAIDLTGGRSWPPPIPVRRQISVSDVRGMAAADGALWIGDTVTSTVYRFDLRSHRVGSYRISGSVDDIALGGGYLWVIDTVAGTLTRVDPRDGQEEKRSLDASGTLSSVAVGGGNVWITDNTNGVLWRVSTDLSNSTSIAVGAEPNDVVYADGTVWVANYGDDTVSEVDPSLAQEAARYPLGIQPRALAVADGKVWIVGNVIGANTS